MSLRSPLALLRPHLRCGLAVVLIVCGCKTSQEEVEAQDRFFQDEPQAVPEARRNRLENEPTAFLRSRATDPVHWQPWSPELFEHARQEQKPVFALVAGGNHPATRVLLERIKGDPDLVRALHAHYICTLVDIHAHPELALYSFMLAQEIRRAVQFPTMIWFSHERNPIAWLPLAPHEIASFDEVFGNSHEMIKRIWKDDPRYVVTNSEQDNAGRLLRIAANVSPNAKEEIDYGAVRLEACRELTALYDPTSRNIDQSGGLVPVSILQFASALAVEPTTPEYLRKRLVEMVQGHLDLLLASAIHDPLDGGFFRGRRTRDWTLPVFVKESVTQVEAVLALAASASLLSSEHYLESARSVLSFAETRFVQGNESGLGLYEYPPADKAAAKAYLWSRQKLRELLPAEEFAVAEKCYGISTVGNIPIEADPKRDFSRLNSLRAAMSPGAAGTELGLSAERARELLESARQRLLARRQELLESDHDAVEPTRTTALNARYVAALIELGRVSGDPALLGRAQGLVKDLQKSHYSTQAGLMRIPAAGERRGIPARGLDYATLLDALFRLYRQDLDPAHLVWAEQLAGEALEQLTGKDGLLREDPAVDRVLTVPVYDNAMVFGSSTWGVIHGPLQRLHQLTGSERIATALEALESRLWAWMQEEPLVHTDFGMASLVAQTDTLVCLDGPKDGETLGRLRTVLQEPKHAGVTVVRLDPSLPATFELPESAEGSRAIVLPDGGPARTATTTEELEAFLEASAFAQ